MAKIISYGFPVIGAILAAFWGVVGIIHLAGKITFPSQQAQIHVAEVVTATAEPKVSQFWLNTYDGALVDQYNQRVDRPVACDSLGSISPMSPGAYCGDTPGEVIEALPVIVLPTLAPTVEYTPPTLEPIQPLPAVSLPLVPTEVPEDTLQLTDEEIQAIVAAYEPEPQPDAWANVSLFVETAMRPSDTKDNEILGENPGMKVFWGMIMAWIGYLVFRLYRFFERRNRMAVATTKAEGQLPGQVVKLTTDLPTWLLEELGLKAEPYEKDPSGQKIRPDDAAFAHKWHKAGMANGVFLTLIVIAALVALALPYL